MALIGSLLNGIVELRKSLPLIKKKDPVKQQRATLLKLLKKASNTAFGNAYDFNYIINSPDPIKAFQKHVPAYDYSSLYKNWWHRAIKDEEDICWPGKIKYFALSSGTSESASKHIPVTADMLKAIRKTSTRQILSVAQYDLPDGILEKGFLMVGGSTHLQNKGNYFEGDLSGITTGNIPFWFQHLYKPGKDISRERDWNTKIDMIVKSAKDWDISIVCGVPAWIQIIIEKIIAHYNLKTIHDIWPNFTIYVHGGVSFEPYKKGFERLVKKPLMYIETYLASEGFIAFQNRPNTHSMELVLDNGIFMEFVPFNDKNFTSSGEMVEKPEILHIGQVEEGKDYALLISTCAGAWRYLIGDTIKFTSVKDSEIIITGRTKHFISLCGEHLSVDNMTQAVQKLATELNVSIPEFTVAGINYESLFAHKWFLGTNSSIDSEKAKVRIDEILKELNDDYAVERKAALKDVLIEVVPLNAFYDWMKALGKEGGQNKFPRVLKQKQLEEWETFLNNYQSNK